MGLLTRKFQWPSFFTRKLSDPSFSGDTVVGVLKGTALGVDIAIKLAITNASPPGEWLLQRQSAVMVICFFLVIPFSRSFRWGFVMELFAFFAVAIAAPQLGTSLIYVCTFIYACFRLTGTLEADPPVVPPVSPRRAVVGKVLIVAVLLAVIVLFGSVVVDVWRRDW
jgi:hypothetical protein